MIRIFMEVTTDEYQLPVAFAESATSLAEIVGDSPTNISSSAYRSRKGEKRKYISVDVEVEEDD